MASLSSEPRHNQIKIFIKSSDVLKVQHSELKKKLSEVIL